MKPFPKHALDFLWGILWRGFVVQLLVLMACCPKKLPAQQRLSNPNIRFEHLTSEDGLSQNSISVILQDRKGFLWFGTKAGLNRYDGYRFKVFTHDPSDSITLSDNFITALYETPDGKLWVGTRRGGLNKLVLNPSTSLRINSTEGLRINSVEGLVHSNSENDHQTIAFSHYQHDPNDPKSLRSDVILDVYIDRFNVLWIATNRGLNRLARNAENGVRCAFTRYSKDPDAPGSLPDDEVYVIFEDSQGRLWVGTRSGVSRFSRKDERLFIFLTTPTCPEQNRGEEPL